MAAEELETTRQLKVAKMIKQDISDIFQKEGNGIIRGVMVSVTRVRITPDLGYAKIYLSVFPFDKSDETVAKIKEQTWQIRLWLGKRAGKQLRIIPEIVFFVDDSMEYAANIDNLLKL